MVTISLPRISRALHDAQPSRPALMAGAWSLAYGALGLRWASGGAGFPFGAASDPEAGLSVLGGLTAATAAPWIAVLGFAGGAIAGLMSVGYGRGPIRTLVLAFGWTAAASLAVVIPDYRVLVVTAYAPIFLVGAPFGWPQGVSLLDEFTWPLVNQFVLIGGGLLWARAALVYGRVTRGACPRCGRSDASTTRTARAGSEWWGRWATAVAVGVPVVYALTRLAWAVGVPLGVTDAFLRDLQESGAWFAGALLASLALGGAVLTTGLVGRWGEIAPGWVPIIGGRAVPIGLAVVPASFVSIIVTAAGLMFVRIVVTGSGMFGSNHWGALLPELLWPIWGIALAAATRAYYLRRRGPCGVCGRGDAGDGVPPR